MNFVMRSVQVYTHWVLSRFSGVIVIVKSSLKGAATSGFLSRFWRSDRNARDKKCRFFCKNIPATLPTPWRIEPLSQKVNPLETVHWSMVHRPWNWENGALGKKFDAYPQRHPVTEYNNINKLTGHRMWLTIKALPATLTEANSMDRGTWNWGA